MEIFADPDVKMPSRADTLSARIEQAREQGKARLEAYKARQRAIKSKASERRSLSAAQVKLQNILKSASKAAGKAPQAEENLIKAVLSQVDTVARSMTDGKKTQLEALDEWYKTERATNPDFIPSKSIEDRISRLTKKQIKEYTLEEAEELAETMSELIADANDRSAENVIAAPETTAAALWIKLRTADMPTMAAFIGGYKKGDPFRDVIIHDIEMGELAEGAYIYEATEMFGKWRKDNKFLNSLKNEVTLKGLALADGSEVKVTRGMLVNLYLHSLNADSQRHAALGGVVIPDMKLFKDGKYHRAFLNGTVVKISPTQMAQAVNLSTFTDKEKSFISALQRYYNDVSKKAINDTSRKSIGRELAIQENYVNLPIWRKILDKTPKQGEDTFTSVLGVTDMGMLQKRTENSLPFELMGAFEALSQSVKDTAKYVGYALPVENYNKFMNYRDRLGDGTVTFAAAIEDKYDKKTAASRGVRGFFDTYVNKIVGRSADTSDDYNFNRLYGKVVGNYTTATFFMNWKIALKQLSGAPLLLEMDGVRGLTASPIVKGEALAALKKYSKSYQMRLAGIDRAVIGEGNSDLSTRTLTQRFRYLDFVGIVDRNILKPGWNAAQNKVSRENPSLAKGSEAYWEKVGETFDAWILDTQVTSLKSRKPMMSLNSNEVMRDVIGRFSGQPFRQANNIATRVGEYQTAARAFRGEPTDENRAAMNAARRKVGQTITGVLLSNVMYSALTMLTEFLLGKTDDWKDEEGDYSVGKMAARFGLGTLSSFSGMAPFGGLVYDAVMGAAGVETWYDIDVYGASVINDMYSTIKRTYNAFKDTEGADWQSIANQAIRTAGYVTGVPAKNIIDTVNAVKLDYYRLTFGDSLGAQIHTFETSGKTSEKKNALFGMLKDLNYKRGNELFERLFDELSEEIINKDKGETKEDGAKEIESFFKTKTRETGEYLTAYNSELARYGVPAMDEAKEAAVLDKVDLGDGTANKRYANMLDSVAGAAAYKAVTGEDNIPAEWVKTLDDDAAALGISSAEYLKLKAKAYYVNDSGEAAQISTDTEAIKDAAAIGIAPDIYIDIIRQSKPYGVTKTGLTAEERRESRIAAATVVTNMEYKLTNEQKGYMLAQVTDQTSRADDFKALFDMRMTPETAARYAAEYAYINGTDDTAQIKGLEFAKLYNADKKLTDKQRQFLADNFAYYSGSKAEIDLKKLETFEKAGVKADVYTDFKRSLNEHKIPEAKDVTPKELAAAYKERIAVVEATGKDNRLNSRAKGLLMADAMGQPDKAVEYAALFSAGVKPSSVVSVWYSTDLAGLKSRKLMKYLAENYPNLSNEDGQAVLNAMNKGLTYTNEMKEYNTLVAAGISLDDYGRYLKELPNWIASGEGSASNYSKAERIAAANAVGITGNKAQIVYTVSK
jgi:hypothetical protein